MRLVRGLFEALQFFVNLQIAFVAEIGKIIPLQSLENAALRLVCMAAGLEAAGFREFVKFGEIVGKFLRRNAGDSEFAYAWGIDNEAAFVELEQSRGGRGVPAALRLRAQGADGEVGVGEYAIE